MIRAACKYTPGLLRTLVSFFLVGSPLSQCQQVSPSISSNLEQTAGTTSSGQLALQTGGPVALPEDFAKLRLDQGYSLQMEVFGIPEWSQSLYVDEEGNVMVALVGPIHVSGDTLRQAQIKIEKTLIERDLINHPSVHLQIKEFASPSVTIAGEVQHPGKLQLLVPRPLLQLLADAGGETTAAGGDVEIHHRPAIGIPEQIIHVAYAPGRSTAAAERTLVSPGDTVYVQRAGVIYVLGAVVRPGGYLMVNGGTLTLPQAVSLALGTSPVASSQSVLVVRKREGQINELHLRLDEMQHGQIEAFALADGDMVYVPASKIKSALINSSTVISAAASAAIVSTVH